MAAPDRSARTTPPRLSRVLARRRLLRLLEGSARAAAIWLHGPPGSGKTTLAAQSLRSRKRASLWYRVDPGDRDVARLFHALGRAAPSGPEPLPVFAQGTRGGAASFARRWFRALYGRFALPFTLVLDDAQEAVEDAGFVAALRAAVEDLPAHGRLLIVSRAQAPAALARLLANGALRLAGGDELCLTRRELAVLARLRRRRAAPAAQLDALLDATQGWMVGALLALDALDSRGERARLAPGDPLTLDAYLEAEILERVDSRTRPVLLATAFLPEITPALARMLSGRSRAGDLLARLQRACALTSVHGRDPPVYRHHPLLQDFLRRRAAQELSPARLRRLQRRTGALLVEAGHVEAAVPLLASAQDWSALAGAIHACAPALLTEGRHASLCAWLEVIPAAQRAGRPWLRYWLGRARLPTRPAEAGPEFEAALAGFERRGSREGRLLALAGIVEGHFLATSDLSALDPWLANVEALAREPATRAHADAEARALSLLLWALTLRRPDHPSLRVVAERALANLRAARSREQRVVLAFDLGLYYTWLGDAQSRAFLMDLIGPPERADIDPIHRVNWHLIEGIHQWQSGALDACLANVEVGVAVALEAGTRAGLQRLLNQGIYAALSRGDLEHAGANLSRMQADLGDVGDFDVASYHHLMACYRLLRGEFARARSHIELSLEHIRRVGAPFPIALGEHGMANVLFEQGEIGAADSHLDAAFRTATASQSPVLLYMCHLLRAHFALSAGETAAGLAALREGLAIGRVAGCRNFFGWWRADVMAGLCATALRHGIEVEFVRELVRDMEIVPDESAQEVAEWPWRVEISTLGRFELRVDGTLVRFAGRGQRRPLELLQMLIALGGRDAGVARLAEAVWPDADGDTAQRSFKVALHRLRRLLGSHDAITLRGGRVHLDPRSVRVDVWALEHLLSQLEADGGGASAVASRDQVARLRRLYPGRFLADEGAGPVASRREQIHERVLRAVAGLGRALERAGDWEGAAACYADGLAIDEQREAFYQRLMICQRELGRRAEGLAAFRRCEETLRRAFETVPSRETVRIRDSLLAPAVG